MKQLPVLAAALAALSACGNDYEPSPFIQLVSVAVPAVGGAIPGGGGAETPAAPPGFEPERVAASPGGFQLMTVPTLHPPGLARIYEEGGDEVTWLSQYDYSAAYDDGMLVATRGLGDDLMAADARQSRAAIARGGGTAVRVHETLDSQDQVVTARYECRIVAGAVETVDLGVRQAPGRVFTETCEGSGVRFENAYWTDASGRIFASRQFISQTVAYLRSNRL